MLDLGLVEKPVAKIEPKQKTKTKPAPIPAPVPVHDKAWRKAKVKSWLRSEYIRTWHSLLNQRWYQSVGGCWGLPQ